MAIKIQKTNEIKIDSVKCVVYGGAGIGKTRLCATAPRPIIISAESGLLSLADVDCDYVEVKNKKELIDTYKDLKNSSDYDTICLDSISEICEVLITQILPNHKDGRQAYGELAQVVMPILRDFRDIRGKHVIFSCKLKRYTDEDTGKTTEDMLLPGNVLPHQVTYLVDELFKMKPDKKGDGAILQTRPDKVSFAKDRSGALDLEEIPNMSKIIEKIMSKSGRTKT
jgi:hypothetical protein